MRREVDQTGGTAWHSATRDGPDIILNVGFPCRERGFLPAWNLRRE